MRLYPSLPGPLRRTLALDLLVAALLLLFVWLGFRVQDAVLELNSLSRGVTQAGGAVQETLRRAGEAIGGAALLGGQLREALQEAGGQTGGTVAATGREAEARVNSLADLLGLLTWYIPTNLLLLRYLPDRLAIVRRMTAGARVLGAGPLTPERRRLLAHRAAYGLPHAALLRHTRDPLGDLEAGRHDALVAAEYEAAGLGPPAAG